MLAGGKGGFLAQIDGYEALINAVKVT